MSSSVSTWATVIAIDVVIGAGGAGLGAEMRRSP